jgi:Cytochrome oxidase complex assembly protein 1
MSISQQNTPQPQQPSRSLSAGMVAALIIGALLASVTVFGLCAGLVLMGVPQAREALERADVPISQIAPAPLVVLNADPNDWWTQRVLSDVYTAALDKVVADPAVIEKLGEPIETDIDAPTLYRRANMGGLNAGSETIEFDVQGPNGKGVVRAVVTGAGVQMGAMPIQFTEFTVTLEDGSVIEIAPPEKFEVSIR